MYPSASPKCRQTQKLTARFHPVVGPFFFGVSLKQPQHNRADEAGQPKGRPPQRSEWSLINFP
jgi:hypothetical protein